LTAALERDEPDIVALDDTTEQYDRARGRLILAIDLPDSSFEVPLPQAGLVVIGRSSTADVCIDHESISRQHARLRLGARPTITNLRARNGTFLRGRPLADDEEAPIGVGDDIELGVVQVRLLPARTVDAPMRQLGGLRAEVDALERARIVAVLDECGGNRSEAARRLGMSRGALLARLRAWGVLKAPR
jgi:pSer/pThr/pTyr-binding forkhead associated (FHA) protein